MNSIDNEINYRHGTIKLLRQKVIDRIKIILKDLYQQNFFPMNLYSQKIDGSVAPVEKEASVAKIPKRKAKTSGTSKKPIEKEQEVEPINEEVEEAEPNDDKTYEGVLKELEDYSDDGTIEPVPEDLPVPQEEPIIEPVESKKRKRQPTIPKKVVPKTTNNSQEIVDDDNDPPKWFMKYVENMKHFQNDVSEKKRTKKIVKDEANDYAKEQWKKPEVRQKVTDNVDSHLTKMYRQIFANRG